MGHIADQKWRRRKEQSYPTNPTGKNNADLNDFDIDEKMIKRQQHKR